MDREERAVGVGGLTDRGQREVGNKEEEENRGRKAGGNRNKIRGKQVGNREEEGNRERAIE